MNAFVETEINNLMQMHENDDAVDEEDSAMKLAVIGKRFKRQCVYKVRAIKESSNSVALT